MIAFERSTISPAVPDASEPIVVGAGADVGAGPMSELMSGGSWFSQGAPGRYGVFTDEPGAGIAPSSGNCVRPASVSPPEPRVVTVLVPPPAETRMYWPLA